MSLISLSMALLTGCSALPAISAVASSVSGYYSYKVAQAGPVEVLAKECVLNPVYLSRDSKLVRDDRVALAAHNQALIEICDATQ